VPTMARLAAPFARAARLVRGKGSSPGVVRAAGLAASSLPKLAALTPQLRAAARKPPRTSKAADAVGNRTGAVMLKMIPRIGTAFRLLGLA
jgi:hypothetical protein